MVDVLEAITVASNVHKANYNRLIVTTIHPFLYVSPSKIRPNPRRVKTSNLRPTVACHSTFSSSGAQDQTIGGLVLTPMHDQGKTGKENDKIKAKKNRVFFLDVNPLCYNGRTPSLHSFAHWISLFFTQVSHNDPVIAVIDGEGGNEFRRQLLSSYKAHRRKFSRRSSKSFSGRLHEAAYDVLKKCNVPVVKIEAHEADDVIATLVEKVLKRGYRVVIASPDKDFKQLISEEVQIVLPIQELDRWSFYTLKHYIAQYNCDPQSDLSLRCLLGDEVDGVPGIQYMVPGFGRKTALKLLKKHSSLENLLNTAAVRTVGRQYAQEALTKYADYLRKNYEVLSLRRDVDVDLQDEWLSERKTCNDSVTLSNLINLLEEHQIITKPNKKSS